MRQSASVHPEYVVVGEAVLRDYPLRLWAQQQEHTEELLREFALLLIGEQTLDHPAPARLVALAEMFASRFGPLLDQLNATRQAALDAGRDRMDSAVPLVAGTAELMADVRQVLEDVDDFCRRGRLLSLERPPEQVALFAWTHAELLAQLDGADPTPWSGPF